MQIAYLLTGMLMVLSRAICYILYIELGSRCVIQINAALFTQSIVYGFPAGKLICIRHKPIYIGILHTAACICLLRRTELIFIMLHCVHCYFHITWMAVLWGLVSENHYGFFLLTHILCGNCGRGMCWGETIQSLSDTRKRSYPTHWRVTVLGLLRWITT